MLSTVVSAIAGFFGYTLLSLAFLLTIWVLINKSKKRTRYDVTPDGSYVLAFVFNCVLLLAAGLCFMISVNGPSVVLAIVN